MLQSITGLHFKKWCVMQSKIKAGAVSEVGTLQSNPSLALTCFINTCLWKNLSNLKFTVFVTTISCSSRKRLGWCWRPLAHTSSHILPVVRLMSTHPHPQLFKIFKIAADTSSFSNNRVSFYCPLSFKFIALINTTMSNLFWLL